MATLTTLPQYPIPGQICTMSLGALNSATNYVAVYRVSAPATSQVYQDIKKTKGQRGEPIHAGAVSEPWKFTPDVGGVYTFQIIESTIQNAATSRFDSDTSGAPDPSITATSNVTIYVGERLSCELGSSPDTANLAVYVWNQTVRATTLAEHGEVTPVLEGWSSPVAEAASNASAVVAAAAAFVDQTSSTIIGSFSAQLTLVISALNTHFSNGTVHNDPDQRTFVYGVSGGVSSTADAGLRKLRESLAQHARTITYLDDDGVTVIDVHDSPDASADAFLSTGSSPSNWTSCWAALADVMARLRAHQTTGSPIHNSSTAWSDISMSPLLNCHYRFTLALQDTVPVIPEGRNSGAAHLEQFAGFEK